MDIVIIERKTFDLLLESVKALTRKVDFLMEKSKDRSLAKWMDSEDVCKALNYRVCVTRICFHALRLEESSITSLLMWRTSYCMVQA